jgi:hypothetical protein
MEDFVTFEIAKKLKEKGFKQGYNTFGYQLVFSDENTIKYISDIGAYETEYFGINVLCPSISQVLKWLREKKKIHIAVLVITDCSKDADNNICEEWSFWSFSIINLNDGSTVYDDFEKIDCIEYQSYEEATLVGIEYVLNNLI